MEGWKVLDETVDSKGTRTYLLVADIDSPKVDTIYIVVEEVMRFAVKKGVLEK